ncbi:MAG: glycoside hydrolase family 10 protein [Vicinamibacterales bacterium]
MPHLPAVTRSRTRSRAGTNAATAVTLVAVTVVGLLLLLAGGIRAQGQPREEFRALLVPARSIESAEAVSRMVQAAAQAGFNTLLVEVRGRGQAYFRSGVEGMSPALGRAGDGFDPLAQTLVEAHEAGLRVHALVQVNLVAGTDGLPARRDHLIYQHPEWLMVPRDLAADLRTVDVRDPDYLGRLVRWTRQQRATVSGLYVSPLHQGMQTYLAALVSDLARHYELDGVHFDSVHYPTPDFDVSRGALALFRADVRGRVEADARAEADVLERTDPLAYPTLFPDEWNRFRQSRLTALVTRLRNVVRSIRPGTVVSASVTLGSERAQAEHLQDWRTWVSNGFLDAVAPVVGGRESSPALDADLSEIRALAGTLPVWAGIGTAARTTAQTALVVDAARRRGLDGLLLLSYDSLISPPNTSDYLLTLARTVFTPGP